MKNRIKLFHFSELLQATLLKLVNEKDRDSIKVIVYGYTPEYDHIEFSYDWEFPNEETRDMKFYEMESDKMFEDIKKIIAVSKIPILV